MRESAVMYCRILCGSEKFLHPLQAARDLFLRCGIRKPNMLIGSKGFSRNRAHMGFVQQLSCDIRGGVHALAPEKRRYIWIGIESALRHGAGGSWDRAQSRNHD